MSKLKTITAKALFAIFYVFILLCTDIRIGFWVSILLLSALYIFSFKKNDFEKYKLLCTILTAITVSMFGIVFITCYRFEKVFMVPLFLVFLNFLNYENKDVKDFFISYKIFLIYMVICVVGYVIYDVEKYLNVSGLS